LLEKQELTGCEKGQIHYESDTAFFACSINIEERIAWWPPLDNRDKSIFSKGGLTIMDLKTLETKRLNLTNFDVEFSPHGLGIKTDPKNPKIVLIAAVNHKRSGSVIERLGYKVGTLDAVHYETVQDPLLYNPNDVVVLDEHTFYATNDLKSTHPINRQFEKLTMQSWGWAVHYNGQKANYVAEAL
jgi:hypothetical protein